MRLIYILILAGLMAGGSACTRERHPGSVSAVPDNANDIRPLLPGQVAPRFEAINAYGKSYVFDPQELERPAVIIFYRGGWCPKCNMYWADLHKIEQDMLDLDLDVIFISADSADIIANAIADPDDAPEYHLLSDGSSQIAQSFGIAFRLDDKTYERYRDIGLVDIEEASGFDHHNLPAPAVFIMDNQGVIKFSYVNPDYSVRLHPEVLLAAVRTMPGYRLMRQKK